MDWVDDVADDCLFMTLSCDFGILVGDTRYEESIGFISFSNSFIISFNPLYLLFRSIIRYFSLGLYKYNNIRLYRLLPIIIYKLNSFPSQWIHKIHGIPCTI